MEIQGPRDAGRTHANRASETQGKNPRTSRGGVGAGLTDRLEPGDSVLIDQAVKQIHRQLDRSAAEVRARREELLARSEDPEAIHRAARSLLGAGIVRVDDLA